MLSLLQEKRPLKRSRLGPPDVYPQEAKQREDELTPTNVKHGFATTPPLSDEFGTAHNSNVNASKVGAFFSSILAKKEELMTLQDTVRKKQQINCKDNFWPVSPRTKGALDAWFKDLAGNKPLLSLAKKAPSFNKKEEIFITLCDNQVNMQRAMWFIKLSAAYTLSFTESKNKKRSIYDPATEWTGNMIKFMKELLPKLQECYLQNVNDKVNSCSSASLQGSSTVHSNNIISTPSMASPVSIMSPANNQQTSGNVNSISNCTSSTGSAVGVNNLPGSASSISGIGSNFEDSRNALKYWKYCTQLSKHMYEESLLDRQEFLNFVLDQLDKIRTQPSYDEALKKLILNFALQYMHDFVQSERLCRKLAYIVSKKLSNLLYTVVEQQGQHQHLCKMSLNFADGSDDERKKTYECILMDYMKCPHHRDIILNLSSILQIITIECPTAMVWCGINECRATSALSGSPLDHIPIAPSALPMPNKCDITNNEIRRQLRIVEAEIVERSKHAENRWFAEKWQSAGKNSYIHVLTILDYLDTHCFDRMDHQSNSIESLYSHIFSPFIAVKREVCSNGDLKEIHFDYDSQQDAPTVKILCEWAVSSQRWGEHRAIVVAILLDKRQIDVTSTPDSELAIGTEDKDSVASGAGLIGGLPVFQSVLMEFLDHDAPVLDENGSLQNCTQFTNLVHLFSSLIRYDVFSHNAYMHTLISRGDLLLENTSSTATKTQNANNNNTISTSGGANNASGSVMVNASNSISAKASPTANTFDDDFTTGLDFKHSEFDDSNVDDDLDKLLQNIKEKGQQSTLEAPDSPKIPDHNNTTCNSEPLISRHFIYTKHFPIPQDDLSLSYNSECNQRYILLFGVGKERDEKKHAVKKMSKEICKLFSKKFSIDVAEGGKVKKHSRSEFNFEATTSKCQNMAYFDQHVVTSQCAATVLEQLNGFALGNNNYLPVQEHVAFLFDLMEMALNIYSLLELCDHILKELPEVENQLQAKKSNMMRSYTTSLALYIVGILRRYHSCLLLSVDQTISMFEGLCRVIRHVTMPSECSSAERCVLAYLSDLYESCAVLKGKDQVAEYYHQLTCIKKFASMFNGFSQMCTTIVQQSYNPQFLQELFTSPKRGGKIDPLWLQQLHDSPSNVYSFVSNAFVAVCREIDNDRLNDIAISCAELTAGCNALSEEWITALLCICNTAKKPRYPHLFGQVDIQNCKIHNSLAVFICILVARHCFSLADFVVTFALPTLANAYPVGGEITVDAEAGARLTCHLVLKLFKTIEIPQPSLYSVSTSPNPLNVAVGNTFNIKLSCDRHLLVGAHKNIPIEAVLAVLKAILIIVDTTALKASSGTANISGNGSNVANSVFASGKRSGFNTPVHPGSTPKNSDRPVDLSQILGTSDLNSMSGEHDQDIIQKIGNATTATCGGSNAGGEQISLLEFAHHVLKQICSQEHVLERCLKHAEKLCDMIIDDMLTTKQVQRVLHMICYPEAEYNLISEMDQRSMIVRILENLGQWTLRISWLDLQLMYRQTKNNTTELNIWLDTVARAAIDVFLMEQVTVAPTTIVHGNTTPSNNSTKCEYRAKASTWLVAPLVAKLTPAVQGRILRVAGQVLESMNYFSKNSKVDMAGCGSSGDEREKSNSCGSVIGSYNIMNNSIRGKRPPLNYQPFLDLILTCLKGQDEHKETLLISLYAQLLQCLQSFSEFDTLAGVDDPRGREEILNALQLRFSLVGGMFDAIQKNGTSTTDWAILLAQLICQGVIDLTTNSELFTSVVDMLATLVHSTLVSDCQSERDENKKLYLNLMKKLKKEIGEKNNASIKVIRQLLPLYKQATEVISCEPAGVDTKGNKICDIDKKQLRISDKQRISVWDILEGHKNPAPLSWVWFGAVKIERKPLTYEDAHRNMKYHTHSLMKPSSYYYESLPLPPEDVDPIPEKISIKDEMKADTPSSVDQSPNAVVTGRGRGKGTTRKRKPKNPKTPPVVNTPPSQAQLTTGQQQQQQQQSHQQTTQQNQQASSNNQVNQMQINMPMNIQQFTSNQIMQNNPGTILQQQIQQGNAIMQQHLNTGNVQQTQQINNFMGGSGSQSLPQQNAPGQQQWPGQNQYHSIQQQSQPQQQQYYQQGMQMNRFDRPQHNNSKQALSQMLRLRQPSFQQNNTTPFNSLQQQQQQGQRQAQVPVPNGSAGGIMGTQQQTQSTSQQQSSVLNVLPSQQQFIRGPMRGQGIGPNQINVANSTNQLPNGMNAVSGVGTVSSVGSVNIGINQQQQQQMSANINSQGNPQAMTMAAQNTGMINNGGSNNNANMMSAQTNAGMVVNAMIQQNVGVGVNGGGSSGQGNLMNPNGGNQFQGFQQYQQQQNLGTNGPNPQAAMMSGFNQLNPRQNQVDFMTQQRGPGISNNRSQYMNQAPNVTMNNMMNQGQVPPYSRQQVSSKPSVVSSQQQFQQQRIHQMMQMQQGVGQNSGMGQAQNQSMGQQQNPNLVAQLQRQYHQPPPY